MKFGRNIHRSCYLPQPRHRLGSGQSHRQRQQQSEQMDQGGDTYQEGARQVDEQLLLSTLLMISKISST